MNQASQAVPQTPSLTVIEPAGSWLSLDLRELWEYRELLYFLVWRDLKVRYKQSAVGVAWALLQPIATMGLFTVIFGHLVHVKTDGVPYPPFVLTGLIAWQLLAHALSQGATSLTVSRALITKVYFPRLFVPAATVLAGLVDFLIAGAVLAVFIGAYGIRPPTRVPIALAFLLLLLAATLGVAFWLSALNVKYRDVQYAIPFLSQFWFFATPIVYPATSVPAGWRPVLGINPVAGVVEGLRWAIFPGAPLPVGLVTVSTVVSIVLLVTGLLYVHATERDFADVV
jgi:homopolymeric O-antigen transport system permease protein